MFSQDTKVQALKGVPLFEGLSRKELVQLERVCEDLEVEPGKVLCQEGQIGHEFFVIVDGKVQVTRKGRRVATLSGGDFVGEIALITELPRTATGKLRTLEGGATPADRATAEAGLTSARASFVSSWRWVLSPPAGAAIRNARSAGPSGAPKSTFGERRAKASEADAAHAADAEAKPKRARPTKKKDE
jgi:hypothetical protein